MKKHFPDINIVQGTHDAESPELVRMFIDGMHDMLIQPQMTMADLGQQRMEQIKAGEESVGGIMPVPPEAQGTPSHWGVYITVADVDAVAKKAQELGAKTLVPLTDVTDVGRLYTFQDPQGAVISVITYAEME